MMLRYTDGLVILKTYSVMDNVFYIPFYVYL